MTMDPLEQLVIHQTAMFLGLAIVLGIGYLVFNALVGRR